MSATLKRALKSRGHVGSGGSGELVPSVPSGLTSTRDGTAVTYTWDDDPLGIAVSWTLQLATTPTGPWTGSITGITEPTYAHTTAPDDAYEYVRVVAVASGGGTSDPSAVVGNHITALAEQNYDRSAAPMGPASSDEDFTWSAFGISSLTADFVLGNDGAAATSAVRITNDGADIPIGATIEAGTRFQFVARVTTATTANVTIAAWDELSPDAPVDQTDAGGRTKTTATIAWSIEPWTSGGTYYSPDIVTVLQELIDTYGWPSGESFVFQFANNGGSSGQYRSAHAYDSAFSNPKLLLLYSAMEEDDQIAPATPTGLSGAATATGNFSQWTANAESDLHGTEPYIVRRRVTSVGGAYADIGTTSATNYTDGTAELGETYDYVIAAQDGNGNISANSSSVTITTESAPTSDGIAPGAISAGATFNNIHVELPYTLDDNASSVVTLQAKKSVDSTWVTYEQFSRAIGSGNGPARAFYGSCINLDPNTAYNVRVLVTDADGVNGSDTITANVTTRAENITAAGSLTITHYVDALNGNDSNAGTSSGAAWQTLSKVWASAPAGAVVLVKAGYYVRPTTQRTTLLRLVAENPAVDSGLLKAKTLINSGSRAVVEYVRGSRPTGSASTGNNTGLTEGPWVLQTSIGGVDVTGMSIYKWTGAPLASATHLGVAATRAAAPTHVPHWTMSDDWSDAQRATHVKTNSHYRHGFWTGSTNTTIYLRMPKYATDAVGSTDPNSLYVTLGGSSPMLDFNASGTPANGAGIRVSGLELRESYNAIRLYGACTYAVIDHCYLINQRNSIGMYANGTQENPVYGTDHVIEYNYFEHTGLRGPAGYNGTTNADQYAPWDWIKYTTTSDTGSSSRTGDNNEAGALGGRGGARRVVVRHNTIDGYFDGGGAYNPGFDRYALADMNVQGNYYRDIADDCIETEPINLNWCIWGNLAEYVSVWTSNATGQYGPVLQWNNTVWRNGAAEVASALNAARGISPMGYKCNGGQTVRPTIWIRHMTYWTDQLQTNFLQVTGGGEPNHPIFDVKNSLIRANNRLANFSLNPGSGWTEDYNWWAVADSSGNNGMRIAGTFYKTAANVATYRTVTGDGANSNIHDGTTYGFDDETTLDAFFTDPTAGVLTLDAGAMVNDLGAAVAGISAAGGPMGALE